MRLLLLTQILPYPPDSGPKVKTYHVLRYLAEHGHQVTLASFVRKEEEDFIRNLQPYCVAIHAVPIRRSKWADTRAYILSLSSGKPFLIVRDSSAKMQKIVHELTQAERFDIVHADQLTMGQFALNGNGARRVFDAHNAVWAIVERSRNSAPYLLRPLLSREFRKLKAYEGKLARQMDAVLAVSEVDRQALVEAGADASKITIVPIAVDCARLAPVKRKEHSTNVLTIGTLFYPPNADGIRWFIQQVYPFVRQQSLDVTLTIVGPRPPKDIRQFGEQNPDSVQVTGYVQELQTYFEHAALMVVPVRAASGMRVRILEGLARGMPIVTTSTGVEGIDAVNGEHLLVADAPAEFAAAVVRLLRDPEFAKQLAARGRRLAEEKYRLALCVAQARSGV